jgi:F-type H+-transporting ATPase subunit alpha
MQAWKKRMETDSSSLKNALKGTFDVIEGVSRDYRATPDIQEFGTVSSVGSGVVRATGLRGVRSEELVLFAGNHVGMVFNIDPKEVGIILLDESEDLYAGMEVRRTGRILEVPVGENLLGRIVDPLCRPLDDQGALGILEHRPVEREAPEVMDRLPVTVPLQTGLKVVDALIPIGRGQRELILGDRQTGKTAIALDTIINQKDKNVICIYCAIGKQNAAIAKVIADFQKYGAMEYSLVVMAPGENPPGLQFIAPYAATTIAERFMEQGLDVLIVYDDLTRHAQAYRELSLLLRRPPGREAFPGDIFYIHSRLLERSTRLRKELGGGSLTALPIVETEAQNMSAYIPTNLISITDGQIFLSPDLFQKGVLPAVDVGKSVSRVGGKTQLPAYRTVAGDLRLSYSQFEELEAFARFGTRLDEQTRKTLDRGRRIREVLKQSQYEPISVPEQISSLLAVTKGVFDDLSIDRINDAEKRIHKEVTQKTPAVCERIQTGEKLSREDQESILGAARSVAPAGNVETQNGNG